jgi:prophage regulatory protein
MAGNIATDGGAPVARSAESTNGARILRLPQVCAVTGFGRSMIYQMESEGRFPQRVHIGLRAVGWIESEIQDWLRIRIESGRARRT